MKRTRRLFGSASFAAMLALAMTTAADARAQTEEDLRRIEEAAPAEAVVKPAEPRKLLVFTLTRGFKHDSIPFGEKAIEILGKKTGAFTTKVTKDPGDFTSEKLKDYDAVLFLNTTGELFADPEQREALLDFVRNGKGLAGIHAATDCCYQWHAFGDMIGGYFDGHPWTAGDTVVVKIEDTTHPVMAAFKEPRFTITDEIYQFKEPYSRERSNVLASLDTELTTMTKPGIKRTDGDFPVAWVRQYGQGRIFYCSLGHNRHIYWNPTVLKHYLDGIQFAMGDLKADASPDRGLSAEALLGAYPRTLADAVQTTYSDTHSDLVRLEKLISESVQYPEVRRRITADLAHWLRENADGSTESLVLKQFVGRKLGEVGGEEAVGDLAQVLRHRDSRVAEIARTALEKIPGEAALRALREAVEATEGSVRAGVITSLGMRRDANAVELLAAQLEGKDPVIAEAAATALGRIGTAGAADALIPIDRLTGPVLESAVDAYLRCADFLRAAGDVARALEIYEDVYEAALPSWQRVPALIGFVQTGGTRGRDAALRELLSQDLALRDAALGQLVRLREPRLTGELTRLLRVAPEERQAVILGLLGTRGDQSALPAVVEAAGNGSEAVRLAAVRALGRLGAGDTVALLAEKAATAPTDAEREAARTSLAVLSPADVDRTIVNTLAETPAGDANKAATIRTELVKSVAARRMKSGIPALLETAGDRDATVASESFKALAQLAGPEQAPAILDRLVTVRSEKARKEAERAVIASVKQIGNETARPEPILNALASAQDAQASASLIRVLGTFGGTRALETLRQVRRDSQDEAIVDAAVRALAEFPTNDALPDVREIARSSQNPVHQALATRGFARQAALPSDRPASETLGYLREALELARSTEDKRLVLGELSTVGEPGALELVTPLLENPELREDAMAAAVKLAPSEAVFSPDSTGKLLRSIQKNSSSEETRKQARAALNQIEKTGGYVVAWSLAGPYEAQPEETLEALLDRSFAPEDEASTSTWKVVTAGTDRKKPEMVDLNKAIGGTNRAAYLRVRLWSPKDTSASLLLGSDDGLRAWFNGRMIHTAPGSRAYKAESDTLQVELRKGWNNLMLKVVQGSGDWGVSARLLDAQGKRIKGLKAEAGEVENTAAFLRLPAAATPASETAVQAPSEHAAAGAQ